MDSDDTPNHDASSSGPSPADRDNPMDIAAREHELIIELLALATNDHDLHGYMRAVTELMRQWSGCEAVGIRLRDGDDYPYFQTSGFPSEFIEMENSLCRRDTSGRVIRDGSGIAVLDCMCGNVLQGRFDPSLPFFSPCGSFWSNGTTRLLASTTEKQRQARTHNRCNGEGYESVALIPLRCAGETFGLLQLNDPRENRFTAAMIAMFERLADSIAVALAHRRAVEQLRDSEGRYQLLIEGQTDLVVKIDPEGRFQFVSPSYCEVFGRSEAELLGQAFTPLVHPDDRPTVLASLKTLDRPPFRTSHQERALTVDGWRWFEWHARALPDAEGKVESIVSVGRDITSLKQAQLKLQDSEQRYRQLFINMANGVAVWEAVDDGDDFILRDMNAVGALLSRVTREEVINKRAREGFPGIEAMGLLDVLKRVWLTGEPERFDVSSYEDHRVSAWFENNVYRLPNGQVVAVYANVTDRKMAEDALRDSQERLALALQGGELGTWDWDIPSGRTVFDQRWAEMLGHDLDDFPHTIETWESLVHPDDLPQVQRNIQEMFAGKMTHYSCEYRMRHKDGHWVWIHSQGKVTRRDAEGEPVRACGTHLDVTESKRLQEQLRQAQKMEAIGTLAGGIAHDFNNLLQVIKGYADMMLGEMRPTDPHRESVNEVHKAAERAAQLTRQLLTFSRRDTIHPRNLEIPELIENLAAMLRRLLRENIELRIDLGDGLHGIYADQGQIEQVVVNLCVNAGDAMAEGGVLTVRAANVTLSEVLSANGLSCPPGAYIRLDVSDTGSGMAPEVREHVFEPFFTTKHPGRGTGLGLSTVYAIVERHHGTVEIESRPNAGTTFSIYLPATEVASPLTEGEDQALAEGGSETVLLAEDDDLVRAMAAAVMRRSGYTVLCAGDGEMALELLRRHGGEVDAVLLDVVMPNLSGPAIYETMRLEGIDVPVMFITGYSYDYLDGGSPPEGCELLEKPFSPAMLLTRLRSVLDDR